MTRSLKAVAIVLGAAGILLGAEALAVIGRPLTPGSYAGVARRTARRSVYVGAAVAASAAPHYVYSLPAGCVSVTVNGIGYQQCGGTYYRPYYEGSELVYAPETP